MSIQQERPAPQAATAGEKLHGFTSHRDHPDRDGYVGIDLHRKRLGELEAGFVAQVFGAPFSVASGGVLCLACTAWISPRSRSPKRRAAARR